MDRYADIEAIENLGEHYPPEDNTDDLVGAQEDGPSGAPTPSEAEVPHPIQEQEN